MIFRKFKKLTAVALSEDAMALMLGEDELTYDTDVDDFTSAVEKVTHYQAS